MINQLNGIKSSLTKTVEAIIYDWFYLLFINLLYHTQFNIPSHLPTILNWKTVMEWKRREIGNGMKKDKKKDR